MKQQQSKMMHPKNLNQKFDSYLNSLNEDKYIPINKDNINSIKYYNNFPNNNIIVSNSD